VAEWTPRLAVPAATIRTYLTENIHYRLDADCLRAIGVFRELAAEVGALPGWAALRLLED
jgi:chorismate dehydratase